MTESTTPKTLQCFKVTRLSKQEIYAIRSLESGTANAGTQRVALQAILKKICRTYDLHFIPESPTQTNFLEGRGFVGQQILKYLRLDPAIIHKLED